MVQTSAVKLTAAGTKLATSSTVFKRSSSGSSTDVPSEEGDVFSPSSQSSWQRFISGDFNDEDDDEPIKSVSNEAKNDPAFVDGTLMVVTAGLLAAAGAIVALPLSTAMFAAMCCVILVLFGLVVSLVLGSSPAQAVTATTLLMVPVFAVGGAKLLAETSLF
mmetsp:Transcript_81323/g.161445  ORF Transcript_81323/g.161445 Transcript_81323/m.161445 type:complete len:162 (-) Transcript_81323:64-549(-)|eukprot:CAMPEP_0172806578 /NCGR_PEP_ID=MMETSP1075-20121228/6446_1 /TAXON_ID=2916 /ORGANISM="Ceratium fusus, Strain PA161109" /LENGTH=161 /DNA_ID=CAMNT_0013645391 /DNA_START=1 /DNA_END=486 /DNA_ORIENTATION=-